MIFQSKKARKQLLEKGSVVSFRTNRRKHIDNDWATDKRGGKTICNIFIEEISYMSGPDSLPPYVKESGFDSLEEWITEIRKLNKYHIVSGWLYKVINLDVIKAAKNHAHG